MRLFRLVATPLLLLALVGLLIWGAFWGWRNLTAPLPTPEPTPCVTVSTELVNVTQVSVRVFNAGFTSGLASRVGAKLEDVGFNVVRIENTDERVTRGVIVRTNKENAAAIRLVSSYFAAPEVEYDTRVDGTVDILLASDWGDYGTTPLFQVSAGKGGTTCVVPEASASPEPTGPETPKQP